MGIRQWLPLIGITICVFIFNMSEFMPIGLLTDIADDFGSSKSQIGLIISFYAWAVGFLSLPMVLILRKVNYRTMLVASVLFFALFQFISGAASSYGMLMAARIGVAVTHAVFWSIAAPVAVRVVETKYSKVALGAVATGTSIAMIVGLPLGRIIGLAMGWRMSFMTIAAVSVLAFFYLLLVFPSVENPGTFSVKRMPDIYHNKVLIWIYVVVIVFVTGYYECYSYIEPFLLQSAMFSESMVTLALTLFGFCGIIGSVLFARYYDQVRFRMMSFTYLISSACLVSLSLLVGSALIVLIIICIWGVCVTLFTIGLQNELLRVSPEDASPAAMALFSGIFNFGIAIGSMVGGAITDGIGVDNIGFVGSLFAMCAFFIVVFFLIPSVKKHEMQ